MPSGSPPISRTQSGSPPGSGSSRPTRWNALSARQSVFTTDGRKGNCYFLGIAEKATVAMPTAQSGHRPLQVDARCVRLNAKAETPAAIAPAVEQHPLSCGENQVLIEIKAAAVHTYGIKAATGLM